MKHRLPSVHVTGRTVALAVLMALLSTATVFAQSLNCRTYTSPIVACPFNTWTNVDVACPAGRIATGGGYYFHEGSLGVPGIWVMTVPNGNGWRTWVDNQNSGPRNVQTFVRCCRVIP